MMAGVLRRLGARHWSAERGMWRCWFENGQSLELVWIHRGSRGWRTHPVSLRVLVHSNDCDHGDRLLNIGIGVAQVFIPLGVDRSRDYTVGDEPSWGIDLSREFGIVVHWGTRRWYRDWPFSTTVLSWDYETEDGWADVHQRLYSEPGEPYVRRPGAKVEQHPYTYTLRSGEVQHRTATIMRERWVRGRKLLHHLGWKRTEYTIDVEFSDEVGERSGSWKGGTIGCGYTMKPGETPLDTLRRMERERKF